MIGKVRLWFKKTGPLKFTSHLDFLRYFQRVIKMSKIPIWYTQGYNPKMYVAFGLPLSLGMTGKNEFAEIRLTEEPLQTTISFLKPLRERLELKRVLPRNRDGAWFLAPSEMVNG